MLTKVVLPDPFGPNSPYTEPGRTDTSTLSSAVVSPNDFVRPVVSAIAAPLLALLLTEVVWLMDSNVSSPNRDIYCDCKI